MAHEQTIRTAPPHWLVRPDGRVQVGLGPGAWVIDGLSAATDRSGPASSLVEQLERAAHAPPTPTGTAFVVVGVGQVADALRALVPGVGRSAPHARGSPAPASTLRNISDLSEVGASPSPVVLVSPYLIPVGTARHPLLAGRHVLPVIAQTGRVVVGPWVGHAGGPCLHCLDLHRCDRDRHWPGLAAALDDPLTAPLPPRHSPQVISTVCALVVLLNSTSRLPAAGVSHEVGPEPPHIVTRSWPTHPACPWHRQRAAPAAGATDRAG